MSGAPVHFPGSTAVTDLAVYDWAAPDGLPSGSPHLHTVSTEAYVVLEGAGELHTLTAAGESRHELRPGVVLWFTPGTIHRVVNVGGLRILAVMQNAGLPESGDAVLTFPRAIVADAAAYRAAAELPTGDDESLAEAARRRRDLALEGFAALRADVERRGEAALSDFYALAARLVAPKVPAWRLLWSESVESEARATASQLDALEEGRASHLSDASVVVGTAHPAPRLYGMCGRLQVWQHPA